MTAAVVMTWSNCLAGSSASLSLSSLKVSGAVGSISRNGQCVTPFLSSIFGPRLAQVVLCCPHVLQWSAGVAANF